MEKWQKAEDLYLRGFRSEYIKHRTGISTQQLLKTLLGQGVRYTKQDIVRYQVDYIRGRYTLEEIADTYRVVSQKFLDMSKAANQKRIECLGCCFGAFSNVMILLLGKTEYKALRDSCWHEKQQRIIQDKYGVSNSYLIRKNPMYDESVKAKRKQTMLKRYGCEHPNQNSEIKAKMLDKKRRTNLERYGVEYPTQRKDVAMKVAASRQRTMLEKYGAPNSVQIDEIRNRIFENRALNKTLNTSQGEDVLFDMLVAYFGEDDVLRNVCVDARYPYHVDFYIKSRDLFIEFNGDKCHYDHWFDETNEQDLQVLESWKENMIRIESESGKPSRYRKYIQTWSVTDVQKRNCAKRHCLNYLVFWDASRKTKNKKQYPRLLDANLWFDAGCPDSKDWKPENTY